MMDSIYPLSIEPNGNITLYIFCRGFLDSDVHFVGLYVTCNVGNTLNGPNKCSKMYGAINEDL